jgi:hypothetical protein
MVEKEVVWVCVDCSSPCELKTVETNNAPRLCPFNHNMAKWKRKTE